MSHDKHPSSTTEQSGLVTVENIGLRDADTEAYKEAVRQIAEQNSPIAVQVGLADAELSGDTTVYRAFLDVAAHQVDSHLERKGKPKTPENREKLLQGYIKGKDMLLKRNAEAGDAGQDDAVEKAVTVKSAREAVDAALEPKTKDTQPDEDAQTREPQGDTDEGKRVEDNESPTQPLQYTQPAPETKDATSDDELGPDEEWAWVQGSGHTIPGTDEWVPGERERVKVKKTLPTPGPQPTATPDPTDTVPKNDTAPSSNPASGTQPKSAVHPTQRPRSAASKRRQEAQASKEDNRTQTRGRLARLVLGKPPKDMDTVERKREKRLEGYDKQLTLTPLDSLARQVGLITPARNQTVRGTRQNSMRTTDVPVSPARHRRSRVSQTMESLMAVNSAVRDVVKEQANGPESIARRKRRVEAAKKAGRIAIRFILDERTSSQGMAKGAEILYKAVDNKASRRAARAVGQSTEYFRNKDLIEVLGRRPYNWVKSIAEAVPAERLKRQNKAVSSEVLVEQPEVTTPVAKNAPKTGEVSIPRERRLDIKAAREERRRQLRRDGIDIKLTDEERNE